MGEIKLTLDKDSKALPTLNTGTSAAQFREDLNLSKSEKRIFTQLENEVSDFFELVKELDRKGINSIRKDQIRSIEIPLDKYDVSIKQTSYTDSKGRTKDGYAITFSTKEDGSSTQVGKFILDKGLKIIALDASQMGINDQNRLEELKKISDQIARDIIGYTDKTRDGLNLKLKKPVKCSPEFLYNCM